MSQFYELQIDIMYTLWVHAQSHSTGKTREAILHAATNSKNKKIGPAGQKRVDSAIDELVGRGHAEAIRSAASETIGITGRGVEWVEDWFRITKDGNTYWFHRRHEGPVIVDMTSNAYRRKLEEDAYERQSKASTMKAEHGSYFWTKWGAIIAAVGVLISVLLWKFS